MKNAFGEHKGGCPTRLQGGAVGRLIHSLSMAAHHQQSFVGKTSSQLLSAPQSLLGSVAGAAKPDGAILKDDRRTSSDATLIGSREDFVVRWLQARKEIAKNPVFGAVAAVSAGIYRGTPVLDLDYAEDSDCDTDMNVVMNDGGGFIELQGTAEGHAFRRDELDALLALAQQGCDELFAAQRAALAS